MSPEALREDDIPAFVTMVPMTIFSALSHVASTEVAGIGAA